MGQLDELLLREVAPEPVVELRGDVRRSRAQHLGELDDGLLDLVEPIGRPPIGNRIDLLLTQAQLTADRATEVVSPHASDEG